MQNNISQGTPFSLGYRMPAEWENHEAILLAWPHNKGHWINWLVNEQKGEDWKYEKVLDDYCQMMHVIQDSELVRLLVNDVAMEKTVRDRLNKLKLRSDNIQFCHIKTNVPWIRDFGPTFIVKNPYQENLSTMDAPRSPGTPSAKDVAIVDWTFNAWGGKYDEGDDDDAVPTNIGKMFNIPIFKANLITEGGSLEVNGKGTLLTTYQCQIDENRNPGLKKEDFEKIFHDYLGIKKVIWLGENFNENKALNDDTDGHIDNLARFVTPDTVLCVREDDPKHPNYEFQQYNFEQMQSMTDQDGKTLKIVPLITPDPVIYLDAMLPTSYANFYISNKVIMMPTFRQKKDDQAKEIIQHFFPDRKVIGVDAYDEIWGQGSWHCLSQQQPG